MFMKDFEIEPGLLPIFRWLAGFLLFLQGLNAIELLHEAESITFIVVVSNIPFETILLVIFLASKRLRLSLERAYLPIAFLWAALAPLARVYLPVFFIDTVAPDMLIFNGWYIVPVAFVLLLLFSWQYEFKKVVAYIFGLALLEVVAVRIMPKLAFGELNLKPFMFRFITMKGFAFLLVGYIVSRLMTAQRAQRSKLLKAHEDLVAYSSTLEQLTISRERNRLARELHDTLAHTLSAVSVQLEAVKALWDNNSDKAHIILDQSLDATRLGLTETRRALHDLHASPLDDLGLALAIRNLAEATVARLGIELEIHVNGDVDDVAPPLRQTLYRTTQEALMNIDRHANATRVRILLTRRQNLIFLQISDNGVGFSPDAVLDEKQYGIRGMSERAEMVGGSFNLKSKVGEGTQIELSLEEE